MRILILSTFFPPLNSIASLRPYSWAKYWSRAGHEVTVLTTEKVKNPFTDLDFPNPGYQRIEVPLPRFFHRWKESHIEDRQRGQSSSVVALLNAVRNKTGIFSGCRMPDITDFWIRPAVQAAKSLGRWDLVVSSAGPYTTHLAGMRLKRKGLAKRWVADFRDPWVENQHFSGILPFTCLEKYWEREVMRNADAVTTVSQPIARSFEGRYPVTKVFVIENGFDPEDYQSLDPASIFPEDGKYRLVYTGSLFPKRQNFMPLLEAIQELRENPLLERLEVIYAGKDHEMVRRAAQQQHLTRWVKTQSVIPRSAALRMQRDAHALLFFPWNDPDQEGILTGKIFEYLFSATPIVCIGASQLDAAQRLILETKSGEALHFKEEIAQYLLRKLSENKKEANQMSLEVMKRYSREVLASKMLEVASL